MQSKATINDAKQSNPNRPHLYDDVPVRNSLVKRGRRLTLNKPTSPERANSYASSYQREYELLYPETISRRAVVDNPNDPTVHIHKARRYVLANVKGWRDSTDFIFLIAALFSVVLAMFSAYTYQRSRSNYNRMSKALLSKIIQKHQEEFSYLPPIDESLLEKSMVWKNFRSSTQPPMNPWLAAVWFISISLILSVALSTVLTKYNRTFKPSGHIHHQTYRRLNLVEYEEYIKRRVDSEPRDHINRISRERRLVHHAPG